MRRKDFEETLQDFYLPSGLPMPPSDKVLRGIGKTLPQYLYEWTTRAACEILKIDFFDQQAALALLAACVASKDPWTPDLRVIRFLIGEMANEFAQQIEAVYTSQFLGTEITSQMVSKALVHLALTEFYGLTNDQFNQICFGLARHKRLPLFAVIVAIDIRTREDEHIPTASYCQAYLEHHRAQLAKAEQLKLF
jgi:hypothetical protein